MHQYAFYLDTPPSANTYYRNWRGRMVISEKGRLYRQSVATDVGEAEEWPLACRLRIDVIVDLRRGDLDNRIKPLLDALESAGVFKNDEQVDEIHMKRGRDDASGNCLVFLTQLQEGGNDYGKREEAAGS